MCYENKDLIHFDLLYDPDSNTQTYAPSLTLSLRDLYISKTLKGKKNISP